MAVNVVLITGGSSGIGLAAAALFAEKGYYVYALSRRGGQSVGRLRHLVCDVTDEAQVQKVFREIFERHGQIDVLVNNAGFGISGAIELTQAAQAKKQFDVNFFGCFNCCKAVVPLMRKAGHGVIVNVSSMAAVLSIPFQSFYSASKSAINALTLALANEVRPFGITVCALMPGDVRTGFTAVREKAGDPAGIYGSTLDKSIATMEHDERNGMTPRQLARAIYRLSQQKHPKPLSTVGAQYRLFAALQKVLPTAAVNRIVGGIYA